MQNLVTIGSGVFYYRLSKNARFLSKRWWPLQQLALACSRDKARFRHRRNIIRHGERCVEYDTEVTSRVRRSDRNNGYWIYGHCPLASAFSPQNKYIKISWWSTNVWNYICHLKKITLRPMGGAAACVAPLDPPLIAASAKANWTERQLTEVTVWELTDLPVGRW